VIYNSLLLILRLLFNIKPLSIPTYSKRRKLTEMIPTGQPIPQQMAMPQMMPGPMMIPAPQQMMPVMQIPRAAQFPHPMAMSMYP